MMTSVRRFTAALLVLCFLVTPTQVIGVERYAADTVPTTEGAATDRLLIKLADDMGTVRSASVLHNSIKSMSTIARMPAKVSALGSRGTGSAGFSWYAATLKSGSDITQVREELLGSGQVLAVEFDYVRAYTEPLPVEVTDPFEALQGHLNFVGAYDAYRQVKNPGEGILVAVLDTGIDDKHPDLKDNISPGGRRYYVNQMGEIDWDTDVKDRNGHGTHISGIIAACGNGIGVVGIASGAKILPVKVMSDTGAGYDSAIAAGANYAISCKARVINMSFGSMWGTELYTDLALKAREAGCLIVAAAGNAAIPTSSVGDSYYSGNIVPASIPLVFAVMAMDLTPTENGDYLSAYSNWDSEEFSGSKYQLMAPGEILSTYSSGRYAVMTGTSVAAPLVAGAAAVIMGYNWGIAVEEVWDRLVNSGDTLQGRTTGDKAYSFSSLNLARALQIPETPAKSRVSASVGISPAQNLTVNGVTMSLESVRTEGLLIADDKGKALSNITLCLTNYSGRADDIKVAAEGMRLVGDVPLALSLGIGGSRNFEFEISEKLRGNRFASKLTISYKEADGTEENIVLDVDISVKHAAVPATISLNYDGQYRFDDHFDITLDAGKLWCLPATLKIARNQSLVLNAGAELLIGADASIVVETGGRFETKGSANAPVTLYPRPTIINRGGQVILDHCVLYEPIIESATRISNCRISGFVTEEISVELEEELDPSESPEGGFELSKPPESETASEEILPDEPKRVTKIESDVIKSTEISDIWDAEITARYFTNNLMDRCVNTKLTAEIITRNTFRENLLVCPSLYGRFENLCLTVVTTNHKKGGYDGFYANSVIGPVKIYSELSEESATYAIVSDVYYQGVGAMLVGGYSVLVDADDKLYCAPESEYIGDTRQTGCPPFVTAFTVVESHYEEDYRRIVTRLRLDFSGEMNRESDVFCESLDNPLYLATAPLPDKIEWSKDGMSCTIDIFVDANSAARSNYYLLSGFTSVEYPIMCLGPHSAFGEPVSVRYVEEFTVYARDNGEGTLIEWLSPRREDYTHYSVNRSLDGETYVEIYSNKIERFARNGDRYRFFDIDAEEGVRYYYQIDGYSLSEDGVKKRYASGYADIIRHIGDSAVAFEMPEHSAVGSTERVLRLFAETPLEFESLSFDIVCDDARMSIMDVSDELWSVFGLPFGVSRIDANTVRVTAGPGTVAAKAVAGETLMYITLRGLNTAESGVVRIENFEGFKEGEPVEINAGVSFDVFARGSAA